jgi:hypothetical protein
MPPKHPKENLTPLEWCTYRAVYEALKMRQRTLKHVNKFVNTFNVALFRTSIEVTTRKVMTLKKALVQMLALCYSHSLGVFVLVSEPCPLQHARS